MDGPTWSCAICTFDNHPAIGSCEMCGSSRSQDQITASSSSSSTLRENQVQARGQEQAQTQIGARVELGQKDKQRNGKKAQGVEKNVPAKGGNPRDLETQKAEVMDRQQRERKNYNQNQVQNEKNEKKKKTGSKINDSSSLRADVAPFRPMIGSNATENKQTSVTKQPSISPTPKFHQKQTQLSDSMMDVSLENRKKCGCQSSVHPFLSSCYLCGRIICEVEGPFNCYTCNAAFISTMGGDEAEANGYGEDIVNAYRQKDKLIVYDKEHAKRTKVYDAQADYYESGTWLTEEEKEELKQRDKKRREKYRPTKRRTKLTLDFAERRVVEAFSSSDDDDDDDDNFTSGNVCDSGSGGDRVEFMGLSSSSINGVPPDIMHGNRIKSMEKNVSQGGCTANRRYELNCSDENNADIENMKLLEENSKAGNVYRSLMSRLAPWREGEQNKK